MSPRVRINKYLASAGYGSRRACEDLIRRGSVTVNGAVVRKLASLVDTDGDTVTVDGRVAEGSARIRILVLNKPAGVLSTVTDTHNRKTVIDLAKEHGFTERLFPVGRLDRDTSGILILTNDGGLSHRLMHPQFKIEKTYRVTVEGALSAETIARIAAGVDLGGYRTRPCRIDAVRRSGGRTVCMVRLREGRKRQIRRMFAQKGHAVLSLERTALGDLTFDDVAPGFMRPLTEAEENRLRELVGLTETREDRSTCH